jgi:asparagine N-glycosylation enzyme membrane subunit Stt3
LLKLSGAAEAVGRLTASLPITFGALALLLTIVGAAVFLVVGLLFALGYNLLAPATGGLEVELRNAEPHTATRTIGAQQS